MEFYIYTFGCKVNKYDSQLMLEDLKQSGFLVSEDQDKADIFIINSCTVTSVSDHKVRKLMHRIKNRNPDSIVVLTGCFPQAFPESTEDFKCADIILGNSNRSELTESIKNFLKYKKRIVSIKDHSVKDEISNDIITNFSGRTRAFLKIEDGCNNFCSYCIIPYARGRVRSKPLEQIKKEAERLALSSYKEVILTGINLCCYGEDIGLTLCDALDTVNRIDGIERMRLSSLEPDKLNKDVLKRFSKIDKLCNHFHISLQSGCDKTLKRMNRKYTSDDYFNIVKNIKNLFKNASITTDIMVGFPGESEEEFIKSLEFVKKVGFAKAHVFPFSKRPGTKAYNLSDQISNKIKSDRSKVMLKVLNKDRRAFLNSQIGIEQNVLFEGKSTDSLFEGYTENYIKIKLKSEIDISGKIIKVKPVLAEEEYCLAEICT